MCRARVFEDTSAPCPSTWFFAVDHPRLSWHPVATDTHDHLGLSRGLQNKPLIDHSDPLLWVGFERNIAEVHHDRHQNSERYQQ